jgi:CheY-like chemotaxis protein
MANILLVEDEPLVIETLSSAMKSKGHTVVTASNGVEGLNRFAEGHFDLVVTDIIMPDKEGN